jgi:diphthamide biosynthesis protein 2
VYVLADTSYNSLSVDEVAASHVGAHCVVHYGRASLTRLSRLPAYFVFPRQELDPAAAAAALAGSGVLADARQRAAPVVVLLDQPFLHQLPQLRGEMERRAEGARLVFADVPARNLEPESCAAAPPAARCSGPTGKSGGHAAGPFADSAQGCGCAAVPAGVASLPAEPCRPEPGEHGVAGYTWQLGPGDAASACSFAWVGAPDAPALAQLQLTRSGAPWALFDPSGGGLSEGLPPGVARTLRRRYYLVEKARNADVIGILVGTLGVAGYRGALDSLRAAARAAGKKTYTLLMGKPSPAKLANFPEVQVR